MTRCPISLIDNNNGLIEYWKTLFYSLSEDEKEYLLDRICEYKTNKSIINGNHPKLVQKILVLYTINKSQFDRGNRSYQSVVNEIESCLTMSRSQ